MVFWGIDTEFLASGKTDQDDVHSIQISDGHIQYYFFRQQDQLEQWFRKHKPKIMFTWTVRPEFGSLKAWDLIGTRPYDDKLERVQRFYITWHGRYGGKHRCLVYDIQPYFKELRYKNRGLGSLEAIGEFLSDFYGEDLRKLEHPFGNEFGLRAPQSRSEWQTMKTYGIRDAQICARAAQWFQTEILDKYVPGVNIRRLYSFGTLAKHYFDFPKLNPKMGRRVFIKRSHQHIHENTFAGRNEALWTGYLPDIFYNDISSLYPVVTSWLNALCIADVAPLSQSELEQIEKVNDFESATGAPFGWLEGCFSSNNDAWGLPVRGTNRNYYVVGSVPHALYHTYDLLASHAEIHNLTGGYKPVFVDNEEQDKYVELTMKKLLGKYETVPEKYCIKGVLNSSTGKLGQCEPPAMTSNFPSYSSIVAGSHYIVSIIFDMLNEPVYYTDTDSFFTNHKIERVMFSLTSIDGEWTIPVKVDVKGESDEYGTMIFRSKHYYQNPNVFAVQGWKCFIDDWFKIIYELPDGMTLRRQIARTFRTRDQQAQDLRIGRWKVIKENYDMDRLERLFKADDKRIRPDYNSYQMCQQKKAFRSRAWTWQELNLYRQQQYNQNWILTRDLHLRENLWDKEHVENYIRESGQDIQHL